MNLRFLPRKGYPLVVQWLGPCALIAKGLGSIPVRKLKSHKVRGAAKTVRIEITLNSNEY